MNRNAATLLAALALSATLAATTTGVANAATVDVKAKACAATDETQLNDILTSTSTKGSDGLLALDASVSDLDDLTIKQSDSVKLKPSSNLAEAKLRLKCPTGDKDKAKTDKDKADKDKKDKADKDRAAKKHTVVRKTPNSLPRDIAPLKSYEHLGAIPKGAPETGGRFIGPIAG